MEITKIIEGLVDLETGEQHSIGVMVRTKLGESFVPLTQETINRLVELWAQTRMYDAFPSVEEPQAGVEFEIEDEEEPEFVQDDSSFEEMFSESTSSRESKPKSISFFPSMMDEGQRIEFESAPDDEEEEFEPEDDRFTDPMTGVASL